MLNPGRRRTSKAQDSANFRFSLDGFARLYRLRFLAIAGWSRKPGWGFFNGDTVSGMFSCGATLTTAEGEAMDYIIILAVVLVVLAVMGAAWLHFGR